MSARVRVQALRVIDRLTTDEIEAIRFALGLECRRCEAEGYSRHCPNCGGVARANGGHQ